VCQLSKTSLYIIASVSLGSWVAMALARSVVGVLFLGTVRAVGKAAVTPIVVALLPKSEMPPTQRYSVVIPVKFIVYSVCWRFFITAVCSFVVVLLFVAPVFCVVHAFDCWRTALCHACILMVRQAVGFSACFLVPLILANALFQLEH
jgi:hypothetical protein